MTKKDYERAASMAQSHGWDQKIVAAFADFFAADNPAFNATRFLAAARPGANVRSRGPRRADKRSSRRSRPGRRH
jgi:hypothetical protein